MRSLYGKIPTIEVRISSLECISDFDLRAEGSGSATLSIK